MQPRGALRIVVLLFVGLAIGFARIVPPLEGFDALEYFGYAAYLHQERQLPEISEAMVERSYELVVQPPLYFAAIALITAPFPMAEAWDFAQASDNPYHERGLSPRQTITLPDAPPAALLTLHVARLVSLLGGVVTLLASYGLIRIIVPNAPWLAVAVAAVVGFNAQFLFISVAITNDAWVPAVSTVTLWLIARTVRQPQPSRRAWLLIGVAAGCAALTKYSAILIAIPALYLLLPYWRRVGWRAFLATSGWMILAALLVAGFWFGRNWLLYGSLVPFEQMAQVLPTMRRPVPMALDQLIATIPWLFTSYWGVFVSTLAPAPYLAVTKVLLWIGALGLMIGQIRQRWQPAPAAQFALGFALLWFLTIFAGVLYWTRTIMFGEQGRLLHAAAPALALLLIVGCAAYFPRRWQKGVALALVVGSFGLALWPLPTLIRAYSLPTPLPTPVPYQRPVEATFAPGMRLLGVDFPAGAALAPGETLPLTFYFSTEQSIEGQYTFFLHLADAQNNLIAQVDAVPRHGQHTTGQWQPGVIFADDYTLAIPATVSETLATLSIGFYEYRAPDERQLVQDAAGNELGDRLILGPVRITQAEAAPAALAANPRARWVNGIELVEVEIEQQHATGYPTQLGIQWQSTQVIQQEYTIFLQLLAANNEVLAQIDQPPRGGDLPTSTWRAGEHISDTVTLPPVADATAQWQRLIIGLYDNSGQRLLLAEPLMNQDAFVLQENDH